MIEPNNTQLSIKRQCELLGICRASFYYEAAVISSECQHLLDIIDEIYTQHPYFGHRRMIEYLKQQEHPIIVGRKQMRTCYQILGLEAVYPKPKLSLPNKEHKIYPYLLRDVEIVRVNQVWSTDITYIRLNQGFIYLMAIIDWYSRYVLDWEISITLSADFCIDALARCLKWSSCEIFNTDQGSQFTLDDFTSLLLNKNISISMDGKGRALDNVFVERLWRSVKYECVYLHCFASVAEARAAIDKYFQFYNNQRPHQGLGYKKPAEVYFNDRD